WENNADGGTMSTYEAVKHYVTFSSCDACPHQPQRQAVWGMSYAFPPRYINRYMGDSPTKFVTRSSMFGGPWILMNRITNWTSSDIQLVRQEAALYKSLRGLIRDGKVYHLLGPPNGHSIEAIESFHAEWDRGVVFVYRPDSPASSQTIYPRGLNPTRTYRVTFQESRDVYTMGGDALMARGVQVRLPSKNFAEIVYISGY
ncbi:MAG: GH36 C-terminal domain-containing protein, partial [Gammaproteobacteria bacterium]